MSSLIGSDSFWAGADRVKDYMLCLNKCYTIFQWCLDNYPEIAQIMKSNGISSLYDNKNAELTILIPKYKKFLNYESLLFHTIRRRVSSSEFDENMAMFQTALPGNNLFCLNRNILSAAGIVPDQPIEVSNGCIYVLL
jgi:hypothetical protein